MPFPPVRRMTSHTLDAVKGFARTNRLEKALKFSHAQLAEVTGNVAFAGRCVHVNAVGEFEFGVGEGAMALFLFHNSDDPDVDNYGGDVSEEVGAWVAVTPSGNMLALVATGAFEFETTEFDASRTYVPNEPLTAATGTTLATCGVLTNDCAIYVDEVCGVVSEPRSPAAPLKNAHGRDVLRFWGVYLPAMPAG